MTIRLLTQGEIETAILALSDEIEEETHRYAEVSDLAAEAEADYKIKYARAIVGFANEPTLKLTIQERTARVEIHCADELRIYKLTEARRQASRESLLSLRSRLDALRTLSANVRHAT